MTIRFKCPWCEESLKVADSLGGRKGGCPFCKAKMIIPSETNREPRLIKDGDPSKRKRPPETTGTDIPTGTGEEDEPSGLTEKLGKASRTESPPDLSAEQDENAPKTLEYEYSPETLSEVTPPETRAADKEAPFVQSSDASPRNEESPSKEAVGEKEGSAEKSPENTFGNEPTRPMGPSPFSAEFRAGETGNDAAAEKASSGNPPDKETLEKDGDGSLSDTKLHHPDDMAETEIVKHPPLGEENDSVEDFIYVEDAPGSEQYRKAPEPEASHPMDTLPTRQLPQARRAIQTSTAASPRPPDKLDEDLIKRTLSNLEETGEMPSGRKTAGKERAAVDVSLRSQPATSSWGPFLLLSAMLLLFLGVFLGILWHAVKEKRITTNESLAEIRIRNLYSAQESYMAGEKSLSGESEYAEDISELRSAGLLGPPLWEPARPADKVDGYNFRVHPTETGGFFITAVPEDYGKTGRKTFVIDERGRLLEADSKGLEPNSYPETLAGNSVGDLEITWFLGR